MPLKEAIIMLRAKDRKERHDLYRKATELIQNIPINMSIDQLQSRENETTLIRGFDALDQKVKKTIANAKEKWEGITFPQSFRHGMMVANDVFQERIGRGVEFFHIVCPSENVKSYDLGDNHLLNSHMWTRKFVSSVPSDLILILIDEKQLFIPLTTKKNWKENLWLHTTSPFLLALAHNYFDTLWNTIP